MDSCSAQQPPPPHSSHCRRRHHHHHRFFYVSPNCPHHSNLLQQKIHSQSCPYSTSCPFPQMTEPFASVPPQTDWNFQVSDANDALHTSLMTPDEIDKLKAEEEEEDEEEEPIFVLTDEWKEFFAKSEAKRRLAKKQAKNKGKT